MKKLTIQEHSLAVEILARVADCMVYDYEEEELTGTQQFTDSGNFILALDYQQMKTLVSAIEKLNNSI